MKQTIKVFWVTVSLLFLGFVNFSYADEDPALAVRGKELFEKKEALHAKFSCVTCHRGSKAISAADAAGFGDGLPDVINKYLVQKSKGPALAKDSEEMKALTAYLRSGQQ
jgi:mono/diheme cytochrome c family protein